jgi:hypothetical protein
MRVSTLQAILNGMSSGAHVFIGNEAIDSVYEDDDGSVRLLSISVEKHCRPIDGEYV